MSPTWSELTHSPQGGAALIPIGSDYIVRKRGASLATQVQNIIIRCGVGCGIGGSINLYYTLTLKTAVTSVIRYFDLYLLDQDELRFSTHKHKGRVGGVIQECVTTLIRYNRPSTL